jgi:hypothetical protein
MSSKTTNKNTTNKNEDKLEEKTKKTTKKKVVDENKTEDKSEEKTKKTAKKKVSDENKTEEKSEEKTKKSSDGEDDSNDSDILGRLYRYSKMDEFKVKNKESLKFLFEHLITNSIKELTKEQGDVLETCGYNDILYAIVTNSTGKKSKMLDFIETNNKFLFNMIKYNATWDFKFANDALKSAKNEQHRAFVFYHFANSYQGSSNDLFASFVKFIETK